MVRLACDRCIYINDRKQNVTGKLLILVFMFRESRIRFSAPAVPFWHEFSTSQVLFKRIRSELGFVFSKLL
jgi:hypothetical protein